MPAETVLAAEHLTKIYRDFWHRPKVRALDDLTFEVKAGEVLGLLGPNGSGKSTTIKLILGLLHPTRGRIQVLGQSPRSVRAKARIGYLPEESHLYPTLTSQETVDFYGQLFDLKGPDRKQRVEQLLNMVGLRHARGRLVGEFSKGMARRIGLAQALVNDPDLILLDEPTSGLDPLGCRQVKDLIKALAARGKTVILSSHLLADVEDVCDRVLILYNGKVRARGPMSELLEDPGQCRFTLSKPEDPESVRQALVEMTGCDTVLDHPRRNLEEFFIDVINTARQEQAPDSGAAREQAIAPYLRDENSTDVLQALNKAPAPVAAPVTETAVPPPPEQAQPPEKPASKADSDMLKQANQKIESLLGDRRAEPKDS